MFYAWGMSMTVERASVGGEHWNQSKQTFDVDIICTDLILQRAAARTLVNFNLGITGWSHE